MGQFSDFCVNSLNWRCSLPFWNPEQWLILTVPAPEILRAQEEGVDEERLLVPTWQGPPDH